MEPSEFSPAQVKPNILDEIVKVHKNDLKYSTNDISSALAITAQKFHGLYLRSSVHLRLA